VAHAHLDGTAIGGWDAFHEQCAAVFGFPAFYGRNMNAWIDCLTYVRDGDGMSRFVLGPEEPLVIELSGAKTLKSQLPEIVDALVECTVAVNARHVEMGEQPALLLLLH